MYKEKVVLADKIVTEAYLNNTLLKFPWLAETSDTYLPLLHMSLRFFSLYFILLRKWPGFRRDLNQIKQSRTVACKPRAFKI